MSNVDDLEVAPIGRGKLRPLVQQLSKDIAALGSLDPAAAPLKAAWARFVSVLDLGAGPDVRACPHCGRSVMSLATLCDGCWNRLTPAIPHA